MRYSVHVRNTISSRIYCNPVTASAFWRCEPLPVALPMRPDKAAVDLQELRGTIQVQSLGLGWADDR